MFVSLFLNIKFIERLASGQNVVGSSHTACALKKKAAKPLLYKGLQLFVFSFLCCFSVF